MPATVEGGPVEAGFVPSVALLPPSVSPLFSGPLCMLGSLETTTASHSGLFHRAPHLAICTPARPLCLKLRVSRSLGPPFMLTLPDAERGQFPATFMYAFDDHLAWVHERSMAARSCFHRRGSVGLPATTSTAFCSRGCAWRSFICQFFIYEYQCFDFWVPWLWWLSTG